MSNADGSFSIDQTIPADDSLRCSTSTNSTTQTGHNNSFNHGDNLYEQPLQSVNSSQNHVTSYYHAVRINDISSAAQSDHSHAPSVVKLAFEPQNQQPIFLFIAPAGYRYPSLISASGNNQYGQPKLAHGGHFTIINRESMQGATLSTGTYTVSSCQSACYATTHSCNPLSNQPTSNVPLTTPSFFASLSSTSSIQKKNTSCNIQTDTSTPFTTYTSDNNSKKLPPISFKSRKLHVDSIGGTPYLTKSSFQQFAYGKIKQKKPRSNKKASTCSRYRSPVPCNTNIQKSCNSTSTLPASCPTTDNNYNCFSTISHLPCPPITNPTSGDKPRVELIKNKNLELPESAVHYPCVIENQDTEFALDINAILELEESMASIRPTFNLASGNSASSMLMNVPNYSEQLSGLYSSTKLPTPTSATNNLTNARHSIVASPDVFPIANNSSLFCNTLALKDGNDQSGKGQSGNDGASLWRNGDGNYLSQCSGKTKKLLQPRNTTTTADTLADARVRAASNSIAVISITTATSAVTATISEIIETPRTLSSLNSTAEFSTVKYLKLLEPQLCNVQCSTSFSHSHSSIKVTPLACTPSHQTRTALYRSRNRVKCNSTSKVCLPSLNLTQMLNAPKLISSDIRHGLDETIESHLDFMQSKSESNWSSDNEELKFCNLNQEDDFITFDSCCAGRSIDMERVMDDMMRLQEPLLVELSTFTSKVITDDSKL